MVDISVKSKRFLCDFSINEKVTVIIGDSGKGKTELVSKLKSEDSSVDIKVSNGYDVVVYTKNTFDTNCKNAIRAYTRNTGKEPKTEKEIRTALRWYWSEEDNFPMFDSIIFVDDEDFINSYRFATLFNCDKYNYYVFINRGSIEGIGYSCSEMYYMKKDGINHCLTRVINDNSVRPSNMVIDKVIVEGEGSDKIFFEKLYGKEYILSAKGRSKVYNVIKEFHDCGLYLMVDYSAFGSNIMDILEYSRNANIGIFLSHRYLSFEYMLLKSNFILDEIDLFISKHFLKYKSIEALCEDRLSELTSMYPYKYSKSSEEFPVCYYEDCCKHNSNNAAGCNKRLDFNKDKISSILKDTEFEYLVMLKEVLTKKALVK